MRYFIISLCLLIIDSGCSPTPSDSSPDNNTSITPQSLNNISTIFGDGGKITKDNTGLFIASNIIWKDSLGISRSLDSLRGNIIVLNFWATWCEFCQQEMPDLQSIADSMADQGVIVIGVSVDKGSSIFDIVKLSVQTLKIRYQIVIDPPAKSYFNYGASSTLPWTFIIDRDGHIRFTFDGEPAKSQFINDIKQIL
jgi:cytochrome c biogenesis protein CcmG/thiol:disulfide interchange protein DsbE